MSNVSGQGTLWNLPNYFGELFTADMTNTPFLSMIGGQNGGMQTDNFEFPTAVLYDHETAAQPAITETASLTAPTAIEYVRSQVKNVTQIFQEAVMLSYAKLSNRGRLSGINTAGKQNNAQDELNWQIALQLQKIARDIEYTNLNGVYSLAANAGQANKTRGILAAVDLDGGTVIDAEGAALSKTFMNNLFREMFANGAPFSMPVIWVNGYQKQAISTLYGYAPEDRNVGGVNIKQLETDFGLVGIAPAHRFMPTTTLLCAEMSVINPITQPVPGKGNFFYEVLAKTGASENGQIFGQYGLDHGPAFVHGKIENLQDS